MPDETKPDELKPATIDRDPKEAPASIDEGEPATKDDGSGTSETD